MSFNRLNYDTCAYRQNLYQSVGPGEYRLTEPPNLDEPCFAESPQIRLQRQGVSVDTTKPLIDIDSELMNITREASNCPSKKYIPDGNESRLTYSSWLYRRVYEILSQTHVLKLLQKQKQFVTFYC